MTFGEAAARLAAQTALALGWRPDEFWAATPAELLCIMQAAAGEVHTPPDADELAKLMALFPDYPSGDVR